MKLVITEKPSVAQSIALFLLHRCTCAAGGGLFHYHPQHAEQTKEETPESKEAVKSRIHPLPTAPDMFLR